MFEPGNKITTNRTNCFEVIASNSYQVVCKDLLNDDFIVFEQTEHNFEIVNIKIILEMSLKEVLGDYDIPEKIKKDIFNQMSLRINNWL